MKTLWKNISTNNINFLFDVGTGKRELVSLCPDAEIEIPSKYDNFVQMEAPQLVKKSEIKIEAPVVVTEALKPKRGRKAKDNGSL